MKAITLSLLLGVSCSVIGQEPMTLPSKADASKLLKANAADKGANISRLAITSCNVLIGTETSAVAETQGGFGSASKPRTEARVDASYLLQGMEPARLQALAESICSDAAATLGAAGYSIVPAAEVAVRPEFAKLHTGGKPAPYIYERAGSKYLTYAPAGQQVIDPAYMGTKDSLGSIFSAIGSGTGGASGDEGALMKALDASAARINVMVDFAKPKSNMMKGLLGRISGSDTAKVEAKMQLSVSGFVKLSPLEYLDCQAGLCLSGNRPNKTPLFTTEVPILSGENAVLSVADIQTTGNKAGELAVNAMATVIALSGYSTTMTSIERNGVTVDPAIYQSEVRRMAQQFVGSVAALARP